VDTAIPIKCESIPERCLGNQQPWKFIVFPS
jgi:hypothetical protein